MDAELRALALRAGGFRHTTDEGASHWCFMSSGDLAEFAALVAEYLAEVAWPDGKVQFSTYGQGRAAAAETLRGVANGWRSPRTQNTE